MNPTEVQLDIRRFVDLVSDAGLLAVPPQYPIQKDFGATRDVTWPGSPDEGLRGRFGQFATISEYRMLLENRQYNVVLVDGSLLSMRYEFTHGGVVSAHNLCYYPCPLALTYGEEEQASFDSLADLFDAMLAAELGDALVQRDIYEETSVSQLVMRAPLRFDYAPGDARDDHAASHVHIAHPDSRVPVFGPMSVGHFVRFVFSNFYRDWIELCDGFDAVPTRHLGHELLGPQLAAMHLQCLTPDEARRQLMSSTPRDPDPTPRRPRRRRRRGH